MIVKQVVFILGIEIIEKLLIETAVQIARHKLVKKQVLNLLRFTHCTRFKGHHSEIALEVDFHHQCLSHRQSNILLQWLHGIHKQLQDEYILD